MEIKIQYQGIDFLILPTETSYDLYKVGLTEKGKEKRLVLGYFSSLGASVEKIVKTSLASSDETVTLSEYIRRYEKARGEILSLI